MMQTHIGEEMLVVLPRLRRFALSLTGSRQSADDLVQGACERSLAAASSWTPGTRIDAWMFRIMRNLWIDTFRRRVKEGVVTEMSEHLNLAGPRHWEAEATMMLARVRSAIAELPSDQREVLMLVCVEEMSYRKAADVLGLPIGTVMSRLSRARRRLAEITGYEPARRPLARGMSK
jgi:RNA polymerase sigma-70 factor (ECF subfamily)